MPAQAGYTVDQLLSWSLEDGLIDSYLKQREVIVIVKGDQRHEMAAKEAEIFLKGMFRDSMGVRTRNLRSGAESGLLVEKDQSEV